MDRPDSIQLLLTAHTIEPGRAGGLRCPGGVVIVEMLPCTKAIGRILLPDEVSERFRPDVGVVLASGPDVHLAPGATVCVRGYDGHWIEGWDAGGYATSHQIRVYGSAARFSGAVERHSWEDQIPLQVVAGEDGFEMIATGHNVVIRREPLVDASGVLFLRDVDQYRNGRATILSIGPEAELVTSDGPAKLGDRCVYNTSGELNFDFGGDPDIAIVTDTAVFCVYEGASEAESAV